MNKRTLSALLLFAMAASAQTSFAQTNLHLKVHTGRGANGYVVISTMISGDMDMLVIDPQFSL